MTYNKINNLFGWLSFLIATTTYVLTLEPSASFWDCGEFIAAAYKMQIVHQPGAPLFLMLQNIFSDLAMRNPGLIAYWMNVGSAVSSGATILFLFWTITALAKKALVKSGTEISKTALITIIGSGLTGALAYTFSDTFWFSAVESEVYAMSSLCTAVVFWAILKWDAHANEPQADRWLLFIAYIMGLSIGVHLLNLLAIPALSLVIYFRRTPKATSSGIFKALIISVVVLGLILWGVIQYLIKLAAYFDLFFVNSLGMGFGTGVVVFILFLIGGLTYGIWYSIQKQKALLNTIMLALTFIIFGYSSFAMVLIRAKADPSLNNSDPKDAFSFLSYLNREQYGDEPLINGPYFDSRPTNIEYGAPIYRKGEKKYEEAGKKFSYTYDRTTLFPRIHSSRDNHPQFYRSWLNMGENQQSTPGDNLKFFFSYQIGHMYARYFMWNFVGRQNDVQGHGGYTNGNWISGIKFIDQALVGGQDALPKSLETDPSNNKFYFLPLILGLIGAYWHFKHSQKDAGIVGLLFFFTGIAIVLYLNQTPLQPRERDYAYAGSFYAFAIWIGLGVAGLADILGKRLKPRTASLLASILGLFMAPVLMAKDGWDDHDRSTKYVPRDLAKDYLETCAPNAILFTYGDNDTYPLWYVQEVEKVRPDVRIVNLSLLSADWYLRQMKNKLNQSDGLPISMKNDQFVQGVRDIIRYQDYKIGNPVELASILDIMLSDNPEDKYTYPDGSKENFLPTQKFKMSVNKQEVLQNHVVPKGWEDRIADSMVWNYNHDYVSRAELAMIDVLVHNHWKRPIYFATTVPSSNYMGLDKYLVSEGFAYRLMPIMKDSIADDPDGEKINTDALYNNVMHKFVWGNMHNAKYLDPESYGLIGLVINNFTSLSDALLAEGKTDSARKVLDKSLSAIPERIYGVNETLRLYYLAEGFYKVHEAEKADKLLNKTVDYIVDQLNYYLDIAKTKPNFEEQNLRFGFTVLNEISKLTKQYKQDLLNKKVEKAMNSLNTAFMGSAQGQ
ncbi:Protein of unknown function [bacterium A37T11]|nr:Protein of unknown function [bacterium A37T11]